MNKDIQSNEVVPDSVLEDEAIVASLIEARKDEIDRGMEEDRLAKSGAEVSKMSGVQRCIADLCGRCGHSHAPNMPCEDGVVGFERV